MRRGLTIFALGALLAISSTARADGTADAMKAFDDGRKLRDRGDLPAAITAFERSRELEPSIGANYNLGYCYEQLGRLADAVAAYRQAAAIAQKKSDPRLTEANEAVSKLLDTHNYVVLKADLDVANAPELRVEVDNQVVPKKELNGEVFRTPTEHVIVVSAQGHKDARATLKNKQPFVVVLGESTSGVGPSEPEPGSGGGWGWQKWTGVGLAGAGLVTAAVGTIVAIGYYSEQTALEDDVAKFCPTERGCRHPDGTPASPNDYKDRGDRNDSTALVRNLIVYGISGALVASGAILFFTAPSSREASPSSGARARVRVVPQVGPRDTGLTVVGTF